MFAPFNLARFDGVRQCALTLSSSLIGRRYLLLLFRELSLMFWLARRFDRAADYSYKSARYLGHGQDGTPSD